MNLSGTSPIALLLPIALAGALGRAAPTDGLTDTADLGRRTDAADLAGSSPPKPLPGVKSVWQGFDRFEFQRDGRKCYVVEPKTPAPGRPWIWRARFFGHEPQTDMALLEKGYHVAYIDVAGLFGAPEAVEIWNGFHRYLTEEHGFSKRPALEGMSRGGLIVFNWAAANPGKVAAIYADAPVCDIRSWPGRHKGAEGVWRKCLEVYGLDEESAKTFDGNPIDRLEPLAKAKVPILIVAGGADQVVPIEENTRVVESRYKELGGSIEVIVKPDCKHHPHSLKDPKPIVDFILGHTGPSGAVGPTGKEEGNVNQTSPKSKIPVILDTDIGGDIDDTWALVMLLKSPELDLKMVVTDYGDTTYRAKIAAKILETAGRTDVPVGIGWVAEGKKGDGKSGPQGKWIEGYDLAKYPGKVHEDGVGAMIDVIMKSPEPITLVCIGPVPNIPEALRREPRIAEKARFVGMHGSVYKGYNGGKEPSAEWNVRANAKACRAALNAPWDVTLTPLDTCGIIHLTGEDYRRVRESKDPLAKALIENYRCWLGSGKGKADMLDRRSSTLFDTVAVYLAFTEARLKMEEIGLVVTDDGFTRPDPQAKKMRCAIEWTDLAGYLDFLSHRVAD